VPRHCYHIVVSGHLGEISREAFARFTIELSGPDTVLIGALDETGLYDTLQRMESLGLELVALSRIPDRPDEV
jgi:hypothetical protein